MWGGVCEIHCSPPPGWGGGAFWLTGDSPVVHPSCTDYEMMTVQFARVYNVRVFFKLFSVQILILYFFCSMLLKAILHRKGHLLWYFCQFDLVNICQISVQRYSVFACLLYLRTRNCNVFVHNMSTYALNGSPINTSSEYCDQKKKIEKKWSRNWLI